MRPPVWQPEGQGGQRCVLALSLFLSSRPRGQKTPIPDASRADAGKVEVSFRETVSSPHQQEVHVSKVCPCLHAC